MRRMSAACDKQGPDGALPETMPAGVLSTPYMQALQLALLPFQVCSDDNIL